MDVTHHIAKYCSNGIQEVQILDGLIHDAIRSDVDHIVRGGPDWIKDDWSLYGSFGGHLYVNSGRQFFKING